MRRFWLKEQPRLTIVVGLAGSGKSWFIKNRVRADWSCDEGFMAARQHTRNHRELVKRLRRGEHCCISELQLLNRYVQEGYQARLFREVEYLRIRWIFFENNLAAANHNCRVRRNKPGDPGGKGHIRLNRGHSPYYFVPKKMVDYFHEWEETEVLKIHRLRGRA